MKKRPNTKVHSKISLNHFNSLAMFTLQKKSSYSKMFGFTQKLYSHSLVVYTGKRIWVRGKHVLT